MQPSAVEWPGFLWEHGSEAYLEKHNVLRPEEVTGEQVPEADYEAVAALDRAALAEDMLVGKWNVFVRPAAVDAVWEEVVACVNEDKFWKAKVSTAGRGRDDHVVVVYTPNYFDTRDVFRARSVLRHECGVEETIGYKPDLYTDRGIYADTAADWGLPAVNRYTG